MNNNIGINSKRYKYIVEEYVSQEYGANKCCLSTVHITKLKRFIPIYTDRNYSAHTSSTHNKTFTYNNAKAVLKRLQPRRCSCWHTNVSIQLSIW